MISLTNLIRAGILAERAVQRVENNQEDVNPHEEEINKLYKWILWRLEISV